MKDMTIDEKIKVLQGWKNGETIQFFNTETQEWEDCTQEPLWAFDKDFYRIKPNPDPLVKYRKAYVECQRPLYPHKEIISLCDVVEYNDDGYSYDSEFTFGVPVEWLISWLDEKEGKRCYDKEKMLNWINNEYTADDAEEIFWDAAKDYMLEYFCEI